jgi:hypothetical protein
MQDPQPQGPDGTKDDPQLLHAVLELLLDLRFWQAAIAIAIAIREAIGRSAANGEAAPEENDTS